ncbi:DNA cytosine methyltransferase [Sphingobium yanoikuyae]|uniref:DNA cytosine methyltransferase n=1 Tax=Sphingobium yanoikuyae TaxID=13690 RepID=A0A430BZ67_SPHYA|nr:DNA cytosine methyltransferase [Sphingobium yanoikuyae]
MAIRSRNILSLCAGVGGLELGILLALRHRGEDGRGICYVEGEAAAAASLVASMEAGWFHPAPVWSDMRTFDARPWRGLVHILASGDPCQDNSVAGKRAGADGDRFLASEVTRLAEECRPDLIFRENVPGNADGQLAAIAPPLEGLGYRVAAGIFSSAETRNTMRRERLFIMAVADGWGGGDRGIQCGGELGFLGQGNGTRGRDYPSLVQSKGIGPGEGWPEHAGQQGRCAIAGAGGAMDCADGGGRRPEGHQRRAPGDALQPSRRLPPAVIPGPTDSRWIDVLDRFPELQPALSEEEAESHLRRGVNAMAHRVERLRATGNGVDPLVAAHAFLSLGALLGV